MTVTKVWIEEGCIVCNSIETKAEVFIVPEPDLTKCPKCGGPADNGHDRELPPNPYFCTKCSPGHSRLSADPECGIPHFNED